LRRALALLEDLDWSDLHAWFPDTNSWSEVRKVLPRDLDKSVFPSQWEPLDLGLKFILSLISAHNSGCTWLFVEAGGLKHLGAEDGKFRLGRFGNSIVVTVYQNNSAAVGSYGGQFVTVIHEDSLIGIGPVDWFRTVSDVVEHRMVSKKSRKRWSALESEHF
jgi:hypothetical protein